MLPAIINSEQLQNALKQQEKILVIDCGDDARYMQQHIPSALHVSYETYTRAEPPVGGLVATEEDLTALFSAIGLSDDTHVIAYDDTGNGKAARLLYTLDCIGHEKWSLLDGGLAAWLADKGDVTDELSEVFPSKYTARYNSDKMLTAEQIASRLPNIKPLDARTVQEYSGAVAKSAHGGHIPGSIHLEWTDCMDAEKQKRLLPIMTLQTMLAERGLGIHDDIVCYCQTHHRSAYSYVMLKHLGYQNISGYPGAWSDWGNRHDLPIEKC